MRRISDNSLVKVPNLDGDTPVYAGNGTEVTDVTIAADPDRRPFGQRAAFLLLQPLEEFDRTTADISLGGSSRLEGLLEPQDRNAVVWAH
jgi:hypothetical protein